MVKFATPGCLPDDYYAGVGLVKLGKNPVEWKASGQAAPARPKLSKSKSSFQVETEETDEQRAKALDAFRKSKFSKSMTAEEITAVDPETGKAGKWVRPTLHYDPSSDHVPPPPPGPIPEDVLAQPLPEEFVPLAVAEKGQSVRRVLTRRASGVNRVAPPAAEGSLGLGEGSLKLGASSVTILEDPAEGAGCLEVANVVLVGA